MELPAPIAGVDQVVGALRLIQRTGTATTRERSFSTFRDVNIIVYLSSWVVTGAAVDASGRLETFSLRIEDEVNKVHLAIGVLRWEMAFPSKEVEVRNDVSNGRVSLMLQRQSFSDNEPTWFLERDSALHVIKGA